MLASSDNVDGTAKGLCDVVSVTFVAPDLTLNAEDSTATVDRFDDRSGGFLVAREFGEEALG
jgi:hypothetical protein